MSHLVSTWPHPVLDVRGVLPPEEIFRCEHLTMPFDCQDNLSLMDSLMIGLLNLKPHSRLKLVNFTGFKHGQSVSFLHPAPVSQVGEWYTLSLVTVTQTSVSFILYIGLSFSCLSCLESGMRL